MISMRPVKINPTHKPPFLLLYHVYQSHFSTHAQLFDMSYNPMWGSAPLSPPLISKSKNTATRLHPAKSMPNLQHVHNSLGSPVAHTSVINENTTSCHSSHL